MSGASTDLRWPATRWRRTFGHSHPGSPAVQHLTCADRDAQSFVEIQEVPVKRSNVPGAYRAVMNCMAVLVLVAAFLAAGAPGARAQVTAIRFKQLIDARGQARQDAVVVVDGERITAVGTGDAAVPASATVVDLRRYTGLPGLIDVHTHMTFYWDRAPGTHPWAQLGTLGDAVTVFLAQENARKTLETGVTTVRDLGSSDYNDIAMRDLINRGAMVGPRMFVAGWGLHVNSSPIRPGIPSAPDAGTADGVAEVQRVARQQIAAGADWIKVYGSTGSDKDTSGYQTFTTGGDASRGRGGAPGGETHRDPFVRRCGRPGRNARGRRVGGTRGRSR